MSITTLASTNLNRLWDFFTLDSLGRVVGYGRPLANFSPTSDFNHPLLERYDPSTDTWSNLGGIIPHQDQNGGFSYDSSDRLYTFLGQRLANSGVADAFGNDFPNSQIYDPATDAWSALPDVPSLVEWSTSVPQDRDQVWYTCDPSSGEVWMFGGVERTNSYWQTNVIYYSGGTAGTWSQVSQHPNGSWSESPLSGHTENTTPGFQAQRHNPRDGVGRFYVTSGVGNFASTGPQYFNPSTNSWTTMSTPPISLSSIPAISDPSTGNVYWLSTTFRRFTPATNSWATMAAPPWFGTISYFNNAFYTCRATETNTAIATYDIASDTWSILPETLSAARAAPWMVPDANGIYIVGGQISSATDWSKVVEYLQPGGGTPPPVARRRGFAAVIGD